MELVVDFPQIEDCSGYDRFPQVEKRVSFSEKVKACTIENLSFEHKADLWFSDREIFHFRQQTMFLLRTLHAHDMTVAQLAENNVKDTSVFMGLESHLTGMTARCIKDRRERLAFAVISEQQRQRRAGVNYDAERMAIISAAETEFSRVRAWVVGLLHCDDRRGLMTKSLQLHLGKLDLGNN